jgi:hypothetical protein
VPKSPGCLTHRFGVRWLALVTMGLLAGCAPKEGAGPADARSAAAEPASTPPEEGQLIRIYEMLLRPEAVAEWKRMQREEAVPALIKGGYPWVDVWRAGGAGNAFYRSILVPLNDLSELDETAVFTRALGAEGAQDLLTRHRQLVTSIETTIVRTRPDLGFGTRPEKPGVGVLTTVTVANGRAQEFEQRLRTSVIRELKANNVASLSVGQVLYGGEANQYFTLLDFPDIGERPTTAVGHPTALQWALGPGVGVSRVADEPNSSVTAIKRVILVYDSELSAGRRSQ